MKWYIWILLVVLFFGFSVFCYEKVSNHKNRTLEKDVTNLKYDRYVLVYALSIIPKDVKNEVFFNSIKGKFPEVEKRELILPSMKTKKDETESDNNEKESVKSKKEKETVFDIVGSFIENGNNK